MKVENGKIVFELVPCWNCNATGIVENSKKCPLDRIKMKGKTCPHCGTKNKYHHYIKDGLTYCHTCNGNRNKMEDKFSGATENIVQYMKDNMTFIHKDDTKLKATCESDDNGGLLAGMFEQLYGYSDYVDHSRDSLETIKALILKSFNSHQVLHWLNDDSSLKTVMQVFGYRGGITGKLLR